MTDEQLTARFDAIDQRFSTIDQRFSAIDQRFDALTGELNRRFDAVALLLSDLVQRMDARYDQVDRRMDDLNKTQTLHGGLMNSAARAWVRIIEWTNKTDDSIAFWGHKIQELESRLSTLEKRSSQ